MYHVLGFVEFYLAPFIIAIGLVMFFKGFINYFLIGGNYEEDRREIGRRSLIWAVLLFLFGVLIYGIFHWLYNFTNQFDGGVKLETSQGIDTLKVPNVPNVR